MENLKGKRGFDFQARGVRVFVLAILALLMTIPIGMVSMIVEERTVYQRTASIDISQSWGGTVTLGGPALVVPVEARWMETSTDEDGNETTKERVITRPPLVLLPEVLDVSIDMNTQMRRRGIFEVPVYTADFSLAFNFDTDRLLSRKQERDLILWDRASLTLLMPQTRSFTGVAQLVSGARSFDLEPGASIGEQSGIQADLGDPRELGAFTLTMGLNGAQGIYLSPAGRQTSVNMHSDWPHPSFSGSFLPKTHEISAQGFDARWEIPHIARDIPQVSNDLSKLRGTKFGVKLYNPVDFYQKVSRATKYGILFIALTFLAVFLMEGLATRRIHPAQFILIGGAQSVFFLLLLAFSEQVGFLWSYLGASGATIGLLGYYGLTGLGLGRRSMILVGVLIVLYIILFALLQSEDYALLIGAVLAFVAVAAVMVFTRHETWYGGKGS